ncbi:conserved hypothetical protein [Malacoplasma penetrans HF-2]|uniref:Uncharacterized protein n=1 Tax=Malacoplasma penetrans (strain HF-2) TaxID=272633 RepID=Q8EWK1_MALP2|nr:DnaD domain protein [Malacoplasma penetrans]BAC43993.1 conserved hypothetical protein [Malacoplasma penetrans HF-2]
MSFPMSFYIDSEYKYIYKSDFNPNVFLMSKLYAPFLNKEAFQLYIFMCEELRNFSNTKFYINRVRDILSILNIKESDFNDLRNNLESLQLLKTYTSDNKVYFELFEPLKFDKFIENKHYKTNLEEKIGKNMFDKLVAQYGAIEFTESLSDISIDPKKYFESKNFKKENTFNFEMLYQKLSTTSKFHIIISDDVKKEIEYYYTEQNLSFLEIEKCVYNSLIKNKNDFEINLNLIQVELEKLADKSVLDLQAITKINHSNKLFIEKFSISDLNIVFKNYRNLKPEQFLTSLTLEDLTETDFKIINTLRNKYLISESLINIMIDFSIRKTHNELNEKYLYKMAKSFNLENISSLNEAYDFLFNWDKKEVKEPKKERKYNKRTYSSKKKKDEDISLDNESFNEFNNNIDDGEERVLMIDLEL